MLCRFFFFRNFVKFTFCTLTMRITRCVLREPLCVVRKFKVTGSDLPSR